MRSQSIVTILVSSGVLLYLGLKKLGPSGRRLQSPVIFDVDEKAKTGVVVASGTKLTWKARRPTDFIEVDFRGQSPCETTAQVPLKGYGEVSCYARQTVSGTVTVLAYVRLTGVDQASHCHYAGCDQ